MLNDMNNEKRKNKKALIIIPAYNEGATIGALLDRLKEDDKIYLIVAHNGISRVVRSYFYDMTNEEYANFGIGNCEILEFEI